MNGRTNERTHAPFIELSSVRTYVRTNEQ